MLVLIRLINLLLNIPGLYLWVFDVDSRTISAKIIARRAAATRGHLIGVQGFD